MKRFTRLSQYIVITLVIGSVLFINPHISFGQGEGSGGNKEKIEALQQRINEKKQKVADLEKSIADYKKKIDAKRLESVSLSNQLAILDNQAVQLNLDVEATEQKIEALDLEIESLNLSIAQKEEIIEKQKKMVAELIRTIHYSDQKKYLEIAANYDNFSEFYNQVQYTKTIETTLGSNMRALRILKEDIEKKKHDQEKQKESFDALKKELENKKKDLEEQSYAKEDLLIQTRSSELTYASMLDRLKSQYKTIENEIAGIEREMRRQLEAQDKLKNINEDQRENGKIVLSWPTQSRYITARFYDPTYPYRRVFEHNAIDIRAAHGTPIKAAASGYVGRARYCTVASCYAYVMLIHSDGISTVYGHLSKILVENNQFVARGDVIGYSGATPGTVGAGPFTTGAHLHFETRKNGIPVDPLGYLVKDY